MFLTRREPTSLLTRHPLFSFDTLRREMDRLFDDWASEIGPMETAAGFRPSINVVENDKQLRVTAELPGMEEKDVEVELNPDSLVLRGKKEEEKSAKGDNWYRSERTFGSFERMIPLPWRLEDDQTPAAATFKNGVLTVTVDKPRQARSKAKKLEIKAV